VVDRVITVFTQLTMSIPNFVMGIGLMYLFALVLHWFSPEYVPLSQGLGAHLWYMLFPALAVALPKSAMTLKLLRGSILSELGQDYIRTAYSKGNTRGSALRRHVLRNAMIPVVTFVAMAIADIMAGSIVVEQVFAIPGMGRMLITSINNRDYPVVQAIVVLIASAVVLCNFLADLLYRVMDPRIEGR
jgi:peptide/nickel transport system permease protein